jgi:membrane-associated protein
MHIVRTLAHLLLRIYHQHHFAALFSLVLVEEAGVPIPLPGDTLVMFAGLEPRRTPLYDAAVIGLTTLAVFCGSSVLYAFMCRGGRPFLAKYGRYLRLHEERLDRIEHWFVRRGPLALILGRLIPGLRMPTTAMAGLSGLPYTIYAPTCAVAALIWATLYFFLGVFIERGARVLTALTTGLLDEISKPIFALLLILLLTAGGGALHLHLHRRRRRRQRRASPPTPDALGSAGRDDPAAPGA